MRKIPPEVIASWPAPNYVDPVTRGPLLFIVNSIFLFLATIAVSIRLYTRIGIRKWFGADDWFIVIAYIQNIAVVYVVYYANIHLDWNKHAWDARWSDVTPSAKLLFAAKIAWAGASASIRLSLLTFFYRLLNHLQIRQYRWVLHLNVFFVVGIWAGLTFTTIFSCIPIRAYWVLPAMKGSRCIDEPLTLTILSAFNTVSELLIAILPIPVVFGKLQMAPCQRLSVLSLLCLGVFVTVVGTVRVFYVWFAFATNDIFWWSTPHWICSEVEIDTALICACAPALRPYFGRVFARVENDFELTEGVSHRKVTKSAITSSTVLSKTSKRRDSEKPGSYTDTATERSRAGSMRNTFDLEGIRTEGFGYKVTITADGPRLTGDEPRVRSKKRSVDFRRVSGERRWPSESGRTTPIKDFLRSSGLKRSFSQRGKTTQPEDIEFQGLRVYTEKSLEIRESFHTDGPLPFRGFDYRNPYGRTDYTYCTSGPKDVDEDDGITPSRQSSEWSLPVIGGSNPQAPSSARERSSGSKSLAPSANNNPNMSGRTLQPSNGATQLVRTSPATAPVNSSQEWAIRQDSTNPRPGTTSREGMQRRSSWSKVLDTVASWGDGREKDKG